MVIFKINTGRKYAVSVKDGFARVFMEDAVGEHEIEITNLVPGYDGEVEGVKINEYDLSSIMEVIEIIDRLTPSFWNFEVASNARYSDLKEADEKFLNIDASRILRVEKVIICKGKSQIKYTSTVI